LWFSWSQVGQALVDTTKTLPSFALCGGGVLNIGTSCQQQGLAEWQVAVGSDIGNVVVTLSTAGTGLLAEQALKVTKAAPLAIEAGNLIYRAYKDN
jgi:hypothetical protein